MAGDSQIQAYDKAWVALNMLIREGKGFSGHERNCAYLNLGEQSGRFATVSAVTGLDFDDDGRGLAYADWDGDGDLDLWLTNRTGPRVRFLRNDSPESARSVTFRIQGTDCNRDAIGARLVLHLNDSKRLHKSLRAGQGHLSQSTKLVHFGLGDALPERVEVSWPNGETESFGELQAGGRYLLVEGEGAARAIADRAPQELAASVPALPAASGAGRVVLLDPIPLPKMEWRTLGGEIRDVEQPGRPQLLNLWATYCAPCVAEMKQWAESEGEFAQHDLQIVAISVDDESEAPEVIQSFVEKLNFPYQVGRPSDTLIEKLETVQRSFIGNQNDLPIPSSFLIDAQNQLVAIYRGPVDHGQLLADLELLGAGPQELLAGAIPFGGHWIGAPSTTSAKSLAQKFLSRGQSQDALDYANRLVRIGIENPDRFSADKVLDFKNLIGGIYYELKNYDGAIAVWSDVVKSAPDDRAVRLNLARAYNGGGDTDRAIEHLRIALAMRRDPENLEHLAIFLRNKGQLPEAAKLLKESHNLLPSNRVQFQLSEILVPLGDIRAATAELRALLEREPDWPPAANNLAWILAASPEPELRDGEDALRLAKVAAEACNYSRPYVVGTLAAAYAESGEFDQALKYAKMAVGLAKDEKVAARIRPAIELYEKGEPYRDQSLVQK
ncbi:MAG: ASPIC/UnbV domain-containing protein [Verrucomicrobiales bacterium]